jgi:hypothetical protein
MVASMTGLIAANAASLSAPIVLVTLLVAVALLLFRAVCGAWGIALKQKVLQRLDVSIAIGLVLLAVTVFWRFKVIG